MTFKLANTGFASLGIALLLAFSGCSNKSSEMTTNEISVHDSQGLRPLTPEEQGKDFDQMLALFKTYYGPYQYKENRLGIKIDDIARDLKAKAQTAKTDEELAGYVMQLGAAMKDGHVQISIRNTHSGISRYKIPIVVTPIEGKAIIGDITPEIATLTTLAVGDEILSVDGKNPFELMKIALKYRSTATELSNQHFVLYSLFRPSYMTDLIPTSTVATIKGQKADGTIVSTDVPWETEKYNKDLDKIMEKPKGLLNMTVPFASDLNAVMPAHRMQMGQLNPIFVTEKTQSTYQFVPLTTTEAYRKKYDLKETETPPIYASLYKYGGKTILLVRIASYAQTDFSYAAYMNAYQALLDQYQGLADVLVLDQTHNPGGSYCAEFYNIFAQSNDLQSVEQVRADRKWVNDFELTWPKEMAAQTPKANPAEIAQSLALGRIVEAAYDRGDFLSEPLPLFIASKHAVLKKFQWKKPMLVLIDSLAGSCGDMFPMLVKANPRPTVKLFGETTMGLGGNVEDVGTLLNSQIQINMTRGLFMAFKEDGNYQPSDYVENNGVKPDIEYSHTVKDFRNGFVDYVKAFSDKAVELAK